MSSTFPSQQPPPNKWWPRMPAKSSTVPYRPPKTPPTAIPRPKANPLPALDEKHLMRTSSHAAKPASKFNTLASAFGLKSKKNQHPTLEIQDPPPAIPRHLPPSSRSRARTMDSSSTTARSSVSPRFQSSVSPTQSYEEVTEPLTPSDSSRHRSSYLPSQLGHDPFAAAVRRDSKGALFIPDHNRLSVMSDPVLMDSHMKRGESSTKSVRSSQASASSYGQQSFLLEQRSLSPKHAPALPSVGNAGGKRSSLRYHAEGQRVLNPDGIIHCSSDDSGSSGLTVMSQTLPPAADPRKARPGQVAMPGSSTPRGIERSPSSFQPDWDRAGERDTESRRTSEISLNTPPRGSSTRPGLSPQASQLSFSSSHSTSKQGLHSPTTSTLSSYSNTLYRSPAHLNPGPSPSLLRQASSSRIRTIGQLPPTPTPPTQDLPPTPGSTSSMPGSRSKTPTSSTSALNSSLSVTTDALSILTLELPPSSPSSDTASSSSLSFAHSRTHGHSEASASSSPRGGKSGPSRPVASSSGNREWDSSHPVTRLHRLTHGPRPSTSSSVAALRNDTPTPRVLTKAISQQSLGARARAESSASASSVFSEESVASSHVSKTLKKQRSLHNTRAGLLTSPTLSPPLRHASSFGPSPSNTNIQPKDGSQGRRMGTPNSNSNSASTTPTTPTRKRALFSHTSPRSQSDWTNGHDEWLGLPVDMSILNDRTKKGHSGRGSGLGLNIGRGFPSFSNPFASAPAVPLSDIHAHTPPQSPSSFWESAPPAHPSGQSPDRIGEHILPPAELISRIEALVDTELPPSPPQFVREGGEEEDDEEWGWKDSRSEKSVHRQTSIASRTIAQVDHPTDRIPLSPTMSTRHFNSSTGSIHERLQNAPTQLSRLPTRSSLIVAKALPLRSAMRPSTAQALGTPVSQTSTPLRGLFPHPEPPSSFRPSAGLPPPPRRPSSAVVADRHRRISEVPFQALSPPPSRNRRPTRVKSKDDFDKRSSIMRKSSFLNIDDEGTGAMLSGPTAAEDSFLELGRGKDSLDFIRSSEESDGGFW